MSGPRPLQAQTSEGPYTITTNLKAVVPVTGAQIDAFVRAHRPDSPLIGLGATWVDLGKRHNVNAYYLMAHAIHESGWGLTWLATHKHNIYGWTAYDTCSRSCAASFPSKAACAIAVVPQINRLYLLPNGQLYTRHGPTLQGINVHYASDPHWKYVIVEVMNEAAREIGVA